MVRVTQRAELADAVRRQMDEEWKGEREGVGDADRAVIEVVHAGVWLASNGIGRGSAALLIGPAGSGKTSSVRRALHAVTAQAEARGKADAAFRAVWLHAGTSLEAQIAHSLNIAPESGEDGVAGLLAAWRHQHASAPRVPPVVLVVENIEQLWVQDGQAGLYGLLDVAHRDDLASNVVLGLSRQVDLLERMEKRVRSRFSGPVIQFRGLRGVTEAPNWLCRVWTLPESWAEGLFPALREAWNREAAALLSDRRFGAQLRREVAVRPTVPSLRNWLALALLRMETALDEPSTLQVQHFAGQGAGGDDARVRMVCDLAPLQLAMLIAMAKLDEAAAGAYTFEAVLARLQKDLARVMPYGGLQPSAAERAFQQLLELDLARVVLRSGSRSALSMSNQELHSMVAPSQLRLALSSLQSSLPTALYLWGTSWLE